MFKNIGKNKTPVQPSYYPSQPYNNGSGGGYNNGSGGGYNYGSSPSSHASPGQGYSQKVSYDSPAQRSAPVPPSGTGGGGPPNLAPRGSSHPKMIWNQVPKKVIQATADYTAEYSGELSFRKGDFFYVVDDSHLNKYEVINPIEKVRGLVPSSYFENLDRVAKIPENFHEEIGVVLPKSFMDHDQRQSMPSSRGNSGQYDPYDPYNGPSARDSNPVKDYDPTDDYADDSSQPSSRPVTPPRRNAPELLSPTASVRDGPASSGPGTPRGRAFVPVQYATVPFVEFVNGQWEYSLHIERADNAQGLIFRTYDQIWQLHVALLTSFPNESGRKDLPRILPFLPNPIRDMTPSEAETRRLHLEIYFVELTKLGRPISDSFPLKRFFMVQPQDIDNPTDEDLQFRGEGTVQDLIAEYISDGLVKIKIDLGNEMVAWKIPDDLRYTELLDEVEDKLQVRIVGLSYKDETGLLLPLFGDDDLRLQIQTNLGKLVFYLEEEEEEADEYR
ncbi:uncharacterized protein BJ171DRAFT_494415 [Polychytrium aggregatum]|uniref:uncharacterized protein n=1 Tax=Polychytrium aggregatum TaxID=110093 RepID=UPI0022FF3C1A|nr:uncharacterized protein BJ171DRAFT_494415 [Polychytrium aggregatum]KAI9207366.1 hypothetical protein BJ171DRAFT_494415 [Polychytrium aggregatum]